VALVASYLDGGDPATVEAAALALGASRMPQAVAALREKWARTAQAPLRKVLLAALAAAREDSALEFLLGLAAEAETHVVTEAIAALRAYRNDRRVRALIEETLERRGEAGLMEAFRGEFGQ
jgi:hypothetical protein